MSNVPADRLYTSNHEWVIVEGNIATIGITDHAQSELGDLVFVQLPEKDDILQEGDDMAVVESVKAAADVYAAVGGKVIKVNDQVADEPQLINEKPDESWLVKIEMEADTDLDKLLQPKQYEELL